VLTPVFERRRDVGIARLSGVVQLSMLAPMEKLEAVGLTGTVRAQYDL